MPGEEGIGFYTKEGDGEKSDRSFGASGGKRAGLGDLLRNVGKLAEVFIKHACEMCRGFVICVGVSPRGLGPQNLIGHSWTADWNTEVANRMGFIVDIIKITIHGRCDHLTGIFDADTLAYAVGAALPPCVDQKDTGLMAGYFFFQQISVNDGVKRQKR